MESGALEINTSAAPGSDRTLASLKRRAWAQSRDSLWQESEQEQSNPQKPQQSQKDEDNQRPSEEPGRVPNKITSWLSECRTPLGASLDDQSASPSRGALRNGCSFEDDLSLGAEANLLQSSNSKTESCYSLAAEQKRSRFKERGRSMNSTGSGKSSTVSSFSEVWEKSQEHPEEILLTLRVSELLDLYEEDPEEILLNLGFGQEEPDLSSKVPSRFFNGSSSARGIDIKVYLAAQMQRMELENPNYALTSRFRQIEVLTTVANEFFQLYSQVSGQPVQRINTRDQQEEGGENGGDESSPPLKRTNSARNVARLLKRTITKHNLLAAASESVEAHIPNQDTQQNGHSSSDLTHTNGHTSPDHVGCSTDSNHQGEMVIPKHSCSLATVTEETNGDGETDRPTDDSPEQSSTNGEHRPEPQSTNQRTVERTQVVEEEKGKNLTPNPEKPPLILAPPLLAQLRTENADSFDMEEIQSTEDEALPSRTSRATDLLRTVSQQSDSSGFAEEPSADSNSFLKVQESSDSCDSETTVTSHLSQDVTTPLAMDQSVFDLPDVREEEVGTEVAVEADGICSSRVETEHDGRSDQVLQYSAHQLPRNRPLGVQQDQTPAKVESEDRINSEPEPESESTRCMSASEQESQRTESQTDIVPSTEPATEGVGAEDVAHEFESTALFPLAPSSPVLSALHRAKQFHLSRAGQTAETHSGDTPKPQGRGRERPGFPMQRSSSLPSSILSPSKVVSSVRIQLGRGHTSCTLPKYSFKYTQEARDGSEEEKEEEGAEDEEEEEEEQTNCISTLYINPVTSSNSKNKPTRLPTESPIPPKPIPRYLMGSSCSLYSPSPSPDWSPGGRGHSWSTQSVPDLSSSQQQPGHFPPNKSSKQKQSWNQGHSTFPYPHINPAAQYSNFSPSPSPGLNPNPYPFAVNHLPQYPSPFHPYGSLPNLHYHHSPSLNHHSSFTSLHQSTTPHHGSLTNLHQPSASTAPHHVSQGIPHPANPIMHHQGYSYPYSHSSSYHAALHGSPLISPYYGYHGYTMSPHLAFPHPATQYPPLAPDHCVPLGPNHPAPGFCPGTVTAIGTGHSPHPGLVPPGAPGPGPSQGPSSTEMQLRRVLHDIRGTVQSMTQNRVDTPDALSEHRTALSSHQSLSEFQQKRRSLNLFRSQMMDLELSIIRQQAMVYKHLSPADRLELEQLQSLRSAVREELQELEQQLEDRLMEVTHQRGGLHRESSVDSLSTASALRAMEPMSDLLREQLFLQSELSSEGHAPSTNPSSRSCSPTRREGDDSEQRQGVYRASINITPALPPRPNGCTEEVEGVRDAGGGGDGGGGGELAEEEGAAGGLRVENLQQLIREIRESVAQEVRQEIYSELLAAVSPRRSPLPSRQHHL